MNEKRINEIRARCDAATPGPWRMIHESENYYHRPYCTVPRDGNNNSVCQSFATRENKSLVANGIFIAHARQDIPWLLGELEKAQREICRLCEELADLEMNEELRP